MIDEPRRKEGDCTPAQDELIREFCKENDVGKMQGCPKCGMKGRDLMLFQFCLHTYCPLKEWADTKRRRR
jgi:hypothetical protein